MPARLPRLVTAPAWMPGHVEVEVVGESFHQEAVRAAATDPGGDGVRMAVLVPAPSHSRYPTAVVVYVQTYLVGYLSAEASAQVHRAVLGFAGAHGGRLPSCPAEFYDFGHGQQVVLLLDLQPLGLPHELLAIVPEIARSVAGLFGWLDQPTPVLAGCDRVARGRLETVEAECATETNKRFEERTPHVWPGLERRASDLVTRLGSAADPWVARAWLALARCTRYQKGRRDDTLRAYVSALHVERGIADAWVELFEYVCAAPYAPMLLDLYARVPVLARPAVAAHLLRVSYGEDRHGKLRAFSGSALRVALERLAVNQGDDGTVAVLAADNGLRAEKAGNIDEAIVSYRRAVAAGSTAPKVVDRLSIWLVKQGLYSEAAAALTQALRVPPEKASVQERLRKRLERCQGKISPAD
ncbi:hypothetical protein AB0K34_04270 [Actinomadura sp. NPDC049382]|uniref:hypothetical protein n=1 Tax=Actinomadura sp. NPDC049382 TaxID=3158220 RepID=UPI003414299F